MSTDRLVVVLLLGSGLAGCAHTSASEAPVARAVRVAEARAPEAARGIRYAAVVQPAEQVTLAVKASGYVVALARARSEDGAWRTLQPGDVVRAGTMLVRLRDAEYQEHVRQAESGAREVDASLAKARLDLERAERLFALESATKPELDAAQAAFDASVARRGTAAAQVAAARLALADCVLTTPIDGVVLERRLEVGTLAGTGTVAFVLGQVSAVKAVFGVPDSGIQGLAIGQALTMTTEAFADVAFRGRLTSIAPSADPQGRLFTVEVTIPNRDGRLKPGMTGAVELGAPESLAAASTTGVAVPLTAVVRSSGDGGGYGVFVISGENGHEVARARDVSLGPAAGNSVVVTGGLQRGERVIVMGASLVSDGEAVRVIP